MSWRRSIDVFPQRLGGLLFLELLQHLLPLMVVLLESLFVLKVKPNGGQFVDFVLVHFGVSSLNHVSVLGSLFSGKLVDPLGHGFVGRGMRLKLFELLHPVLGRFGGFLGLVVVDGQRWHYSVFLFGLWLAFLSVNGGLFRAEQPVGGLRQGLDCST